MPVETVRKALPDLCATLFSYVMWLRRSESAAKTEAKAVYQRFDELLRELDAEGQRAGVAPANVRLVMFAMAAYADEAILTSQLPFRQQWADQPLQLAYFNENAAGEEFYTRLETLRRGATPEVADVLESYYLCLSLGFKGRYGGAPRLEKQRRSLIDQLGSEIRALHGESAGSLSPNAARPERAMRSPRRASLWAVPAVCLLALAVLALAASAGLAGVSRAASGALATGAP